MLGCSSFGRGGQPDVVYKTCSLVKDLYCKVLRKGSVLSAFLLIQAEIDVLPPLRPPHVLPEATKQMVEGTMELD